MKCTKAEQEKDNFLSPDEFAERMGGRSRGTPQNYARYLAMIPFPPTCVCENCRRERVREMANHPTPGISSEYLFEKRKQERGERNLLDD